MDRALTHFAPLRCIARKAPMRFVWFYRSPRSISFWENSRESTSFSEESSEFSQTTYQDETGEVFVRISLSARGSLGGYSSKFAGLIDISPDIRGSTPRVKFLFCVAYHGSGNCIGSSTIRTERLRLLQHSLYWFLARGSIKLSHDE